eukprot:NODE_14559_length_235_cov_8.591398_g13646_i0.p2 GENE.NODE_14559_length_235_cov_8.591398_g13646_i0~~NODE_14559_length_235_cov_8.591398_g13646_i0.p2  ORF type:complete len:55 (-),score=8.48 NODE_14559_length_235_cov_8.591398_g13646_i0:4-168(-)
MLLMLLRLVYLSFFSLGTVFTATESPLRSHAVDTIMLASMPKHISRRGAPCTLR